MYSVIKYKFYYLKTKIYNERINLTKLQCKKY